MVNAAAERTRGAGHVEDTDARMGRKGPKCQKRSPRVPSKGRCKYELEGYSVGHTWEGKDVPMSHLSREDAAVGWLSTPESPAGSDSACWGCCGYHCRCA